MATLTENARKFLAKNPTLIYQRMGWKFYECPNRGDEGELWVITPEGKVKRTDFWEADDVALCDFEYITRY